jgi:chaperonin GroEL
LQDLAVYTGAKVFNGVNVPLSSAKLSDLGQCEKSIVSKHRSVLLGPKDTEDNPAQERIQKRLEELETQMKAVDRDYDGEIIRERIGNLIGGIATIYVGGDSDLEMKERRDRVEDTINAVRSAVEKGVVTGGGAALLGIANHIRNSSLGTRRARTIIAASLEVPFNRILTNVGVHQTEIDALAKSILIDTKTVPNTTFDCLKMEMVQGMEGGIIDPAKVVVSVIKNAMSIAKMLLTLGGAVVIGRDKILERDAEMQALQTAKAMAEME